MKAAAAALLLLAAGCGGAGQKPATPRVAPKAAAHRPCHKSDLPACADACLRHDGAACTLLGGMSEAGEGMKANVDRAAQLYTRGCDAGDARGCGRLGLLEQAGKGVDVDESRAALHLQKGCDAGLVEACVALPDALEKLHGTFDASTVVALARACELGAPKGCFTAGFAYDEGRGVTADQAKATALYRRGCDAGDGSACGNLAVRMPEKTDADRKRNAALLRRACDLNDPSGCMNLAQRLADGEGVPRDEAAAAALNAKWCAKDPQQYHFACAAYGGLLAAGRGVARDKGKAYALLRAACDVDALDCETGERAFARQDAKRAREFRIDACLRGRSQSSCDRLYHDAIRGGRHTIAGIKEHETQVSCTIRRLAPACLDLEAVLRRGGVIFPRNAKAADEAHQAACKMWHDQLSDAKAVERFKKACAAPNAGILTKDRKAR